MLGAALSGRLTKFLNDWKFDPLAVMPLIFVLFLFVVNAYDPNTLSAGLAMVVATSPAWLPAFLAVFFWISWIDYIRFLFWFNQDFVILEVQLPQEVTKNPLAMEVVLSSLWNAGGETTFIARVFEGKYRPVWSLEIASNEGRIGFYMHMRRGWRNIIEARLYGQFPEAKVVEVDDYVAKVPFNLKDYDIFGAEFRKGGLDALPLKTYIDYGLDKDPKEEFKIDPMTNIFETLSQIGKNEHFWMQIILKARRDESEWYGIRNKSKDAFKQPAAAEIKSIIANAAKRVGDYIDDPLLKKQAQTQAASRAQALLNDAEKNRIEQINRSMSKLIFEAGIRVVYLAKKENYVGINGGSIIRFFDAFKGHDASRDYNSLGVSGGTTIFDYPWQDFKSIRLNILKENLFFQFKNRAYFYVPYDQKPIFINIEELATLWHFPSSIVQTPGLNRVSSRRSEAPVNLPIG